MNANSNKPIATPQGQAANQADDFDSVERLKEFMYLYQEMDKWGHVQIHFVITRSLWALALKERTPERLRWAVDSTISDFRFVFIPYFWPYIWRALLVGSAGLLAGFTIERLLGGL